MNSSVSVLRLSSPVLCLLAFVCLAHAQPSGGPYGPQARKYEIPANAAHVYYVAPDGKADASGATLAEPTTLESAIARVVTGDAVILRGGTYRTGGLMLNQGITLQPCADEQPVLKGTQVVTQAEAQRNGLWRAAWPHLFPAKPQDWWRRGSEGRMTPLWRFNNDMVFVDGQMLQAVGWEGDVNEHTYYIDYEKGQVYLPVDPARHLVEITAFDSAIVRTTTRVHGKDNDHRGYTLRGLTFTQYAYRALEIEGKRRFTANDEPTDEPVGVADPSTYGKEVVGTTIENCAITFCSRVAGYFRGDRFTMRQCLVSDTSTEGVYLLASSDCLLEKNIFRRNNIENISGYYPAAVKIFNQTHRVVCRDNLILDNANSNGLWYDVGNVDGVFINNWVQDCIDGFFFEISKGVIVAGNVLVNCDKGVRILNSSNARVYHNTFVNTVASFERTERSAAGDHFGWHPATGPDVDQREGHVFTGNLLVADASFTQPLLRFEQTKVLCGKLTRPMAVKVDGNVYVRADATARPLIVWSPADGEDCTVKLDTPAGLAKLLPQFEAHSQLLVRDPHAVLRSPELKNYELLPAFTTTVSADTLAPEAQSLLGWSAEDATTPGAYPARR
jgi:parallel beta-helix repeat protein